MSAVCVCVWTDAGVVVGVAVAGRVAAQSRLNKFTTALVKVNTALETDSGVDPNDVDVDSAWVAFRLLLQDLGNFRKALAEQEAKNKAVQMDDD